MKICPLNWWPKVSRETNNEFVYKSSIRKCELFEVEIMSSVLWIANTYISSLIKTRSKRSASECCASGVTGQ